MVKFFTIVLFMTCVSFARYDYPTYSGYSGYTGRYIPQYPRRYPGELRPSDRLQRAEYIYRAVRSASYSHDYVTPVINILRYFGM